MDVVRVVFAKWGGRPHWEYDARVLGTDGHGTWLGLPTGTLIARPGASFTTDTAQVVLVPEEPFVATFFSPGTRAPCAVYVDVTTVPVRRPGRLEVVDLDLDVLRGWTGRVWVDDEDEFADHRARFGYPPEVVDLALASCARQRAAVAAGTAPYDPDTANRWLTAL